MADRKASSCADGLAWGVLSNGRRCSSCSVWRQHPGEAVRRALIIVLSRHQPGDTVRYSEIIPLQRALDLRAGRTAEVLQEKACSTMTAARHSRTGWSASSTAWPPGIRADTEAWLRTLRDGGPRSRPRRDRGTARGLGWA